MLDALLSISILNHFLQNVTCSMWVGGLYLEFVEALKKSEATAEANLLSIIQADPSWQSKAWILERRCPEHWGRRGRLDASLNSNVEVKFTAIKELSEKEWNEQVVNRGNRLELPA